MNNQEKRVPVRMCIACRERFPQGSLIRIGKKLEENDFFISIEASNKKKCAGRSVYLCKSEKCIANVKKKKLLGKALKCEIPANLIETLEKAIKTTIEE